MAKAKAVEPGRGQGRAPAPVADPNATKAGHVMTNAQRAQFDAMRRTNPSGAAAYKAGIVGAQGAGQTTPQNLIDNSNQIGGMGQDIVKQNIDTGDWGSFDPESKIAPRGEYQPFNPELTPRTGTGDLVADRKRIEDEVFGRLTRGADTQFARSAQDKAQELHDKGIPMGSQRYNEEMDRWDKQKNDYYLDARSNATQLGGQEYERSFGIGEQTRANDYSQQYGTHGINFNEGEQRRGNEFGEQIAIRGQRQGEMDQLNRFGQQGIDNENQRQQIDIQRRQVQAAMDALKKNRGGRGPGDGRVHGYGGRGPDSGDGNDLSFY